MIERIFNVLGENLESRNPPRYLLEWVEGTHFVIVITGTSFPCRGSDSSVTVSFIWL